MIDSNYNNTDRFADLLEEQVSQSILKVFAARSKTKAKPQRRELVDLPSIILMNERKWIDIEPGDSFLCVRDFEENHQSLSTLKQYNEKTMEQFNSGRSRIIFKINFHKHSNWSDDR